MNPKNVIFEHVDHVGNRIVCVDKPNGDRLHQLDTEEYRLLHTISNGKMRVFINNKRKEGGVEYAELYFFPIRDSNATIIVEEGNNVHEVPHHVIVNEGTFLGYHDETLQKKIYFPVDRLRMFKI